MDRGEVELLIHLTLAPPETAELERQVPPVPPVLREIVVRPLFFVYPYPEDLPVRGAMPLRPVQQLITDKTALPITVPPVLLTLMLRQLTPKEADLEAQGVVLIISAFVFALAMYMKKEEFTEALAEEERVQ